MEAEKKSEKLRPTVRKCRTTFGARSHSAGQPERAGRKTAADEKEE
jgi:hypothetical protein